MQFMLIHAFGTLPNVCILTSTHVTRPFRCSPTEVLLRCYKPCTNLLKIVTTAENSIALIPLPPATVIPVIALSKISANIQDI